MAMKPADVGSRLDEQDEEFACAPLQPVGQRARYTSEDLAGLRVGHRMDDVMDGQELILADTNVLDDADDELISKSVLEQQRVAELERYKRNKGLPTYKMFDHDDSLLPQYDDDGKKSGQGFILGSETAQESKARAQHLREEAAMRAKQLMYSLNDTSQQQVKVAEEFVVRKKKDKKDKKGKKEKKLRSKKLISELAEDASSDDVDDQEDRGKRGSDQRGGDKAQEKVESLLEKEQRYKKAKLEAMKKTKEKLYDVPDLEDDEKLVLGAVAPRKVDVKGEAVDIAKRLEERRKRDKEKKEEAGMVFSSVAEFARAVKTEPLDDPTVVVAVKREPAAAAAVVVKQETKPTAGGGVGNEEEEEEREEGEIEPEDLPFQETEPVVATGMAATLEYLRIRGLTGQREGVVSRVRDMSVSKTKKEYFEDDQDAELHDGEGHRVDLRKYDEFGRPVSRKEAFRLLSQGFHGNKSGPMAQERRLRSVIKEAKMKEKLTSSATERDLAKVEKKQKATGSAAISLTMDTAEMEQLQEAAKLAVQKKLSKMGTEDRKKKTAATKK